MNNTFRHLCAFPLFAVLSACIAFPTSTGDDEPFTKTTLGFIEVGKSTKEDIVTAMPLPVEFLDGDLWLYVKTRSEGDTTLLVWNSGRTFHNVDYRYLLIRFNKDGVVAHYKTSTSEKPEGCNRSGVCGIDSTYMLVASQEQDQAVKLFDIPENRCGIYVYGKPRTAIHLRLDGHKIGGLLGEQGFIFERLYRGAHELIVSGPDVKGYTPVEFSCKAGSSVFLRITAERPGRFVGPLKIEVTQRDTAEGRQAILKRDLMLGADT
jgi:hypothetical protein